MSFSFTENKPLILVAICIITWAVYYNSLIVPFYLDDIRSIANNSIVQKGSILELFNAFGMRFITYLTFWIDYQIVGTLSSVDSILKQLHITNIIVHMLNGFLVFGLTYLLAYKTPSILNKTYGSNNNLGSHALSIFPFVCALIYVVHPLHSQAVTYIVQRTTALVSLFYFASLLSYLCFRLTKSIWQKTMFFFLTFCLVGLAFFTKQNSFTIPIIIILIELIFFNSLKFRHLTILSLVILLVSVFAYIVDSQTITSFAIKFDKLTRENLSYSRLDYFLAQMNILWIYIGKFFIPFPIRFEYPYEIDSFPPWQTIMASIAHVLIISFAIIKRKKSPLIAFGILFYYVTHSVESGLIPITDLTFEHRAYLPNFGLIVVLIGSLIYVKDKWLASSKFISLAFVFPIVIIFAIITNYRNTQWQQPILFFEHDLSLYPNSCRTLNNLANQYDILGDKVKALNLAEQCIKLKDGKLTNPEIINNYVALLVANKHYKTADAAALQALTFIHDPVNRRIILENLGMSKLNQKQYAYAEWSLKEAIKLPSPYPRSYFALAISLLKQGKNAEAKSFVQLGLKLQPNSELGVKLLAIL